MNLAESNVSTGKRKPCSTCKRPLPVCLCAAYPLTCPLPDKFLQVARVIIIQYLAESHCAKNTVSLLQHMLGPVHLKVVLLKGSFNTQKQVLEQQCTDWWGERDSQLRQSTCLLYPRQDAMDLQEFMQNFRANRENGSSSYESSPIRTIVAIDATWPTALRLYKLHQQLFDTMNAFRISLPAGQETGVYQRMRKEPSTSHLATLEAVSLALLAVENREQVHTTLMKPLLAMISLHESFQAAGLERKRKLLQVDNGDSCS